MEKEPKSESVIIERPDGSRVSIPKSIHREVIKVESHDRVARALVAGALLVNAGLAGVYLLTRASEAREFKEMQVSVSEVVSPRVLAEMKGNIDRLELQACFNENMIRTVYDIPSASLEECLDFWQEQLDEANQQ